MDLWYKSSGRLTVSDGLSRNDQAGYGGLVWKDADDVGSALDLAVEAPDRIGRVQLCAMLPGSGYSAITQLLYRKPRWPPAAGHDHLTDFEWSVIQPLLPNKPRGVPCVDDRRVLNGIFWRLRTGAPWADIRAMPRRIGPPAFGGW
jgi:hypothetical protein